MSTAHVRFGFNTSCISVPHRTRSKGLPLILPIIAHSPGPFLPEMAFWPESHRSVAPRHNFSHRLCRRHKLTNWGRSFLRRTTADKRPSSRRPLASTEDGRAPQAHTECSTICGHDSGPGTDLGERINLRKRLALQTRDSATKLFGWQGALPATATSSTLVGKLCTLGLLNSGRRSGGFSFDGRLCRRSKRHCWQGHSLISLH